MSKPLFMVVSLTAISTASGLSLGLMNSATKARIEEQVLKHKKLPAVKRVLREASNDLLKDRKKCSFGDGKVTRLLFPGRKGSGKPPYAVAFEWKSKGFGGEMTVVLGIDLTTDRITGMAVAAHSETPGVGSRVAEPSFTSQFKGMGSDTVFRVKADGGAVDAVSGATISSRAATKAVDEAYHWYLKHKREISDMFTATEGT